MSKRLIDLTGQRFGKLLVISYSSKDEQLRANWKCVCDCGGFTVVRGDNLRKGSSTSCGKCSPFTKNFTKNTSSMDYMANNVLKRYKADAKRRGYSFSLSKKEVIELITSNCYFCGRVPSLAFVRDDEVLYRNGIDRMDNEQGYMKENCVPCCTMCNRMKLNYSFENFMEQIKRIFKAHN